MDLLYQIDGERFVRFLDATIALMRDGEFQAINVVSKCRPVKERYLDPARRGSITDLELTTIAGLSDVVDLDDPVWIPAPEARGAFAKLDQPQR